MGVSGSHKTVRYLSEIINNSITNLYLLAGNQLDNNNEWLGDMTKHEEQQQSNVVQEHGEAIIGDTTRTRKNFDIFVAQCLWLLLSFWRYPVDMAGLNIYLFIPLPVAQKHLY